MILSAQNIHKTINKKTILKDISLRLESGRVYGLTGHNGCGKTMLFRALSGLMRIDSGNITLDDKMLGKDFSILPELGILLENIGLYPYLTGYQNLEYLAQFRKSVGKNEIKETLTRVGLNPNDRRVYRKYSLGMKQRLAVAQAILESPKILILDEPTNSLDQEGVALLYQIVEEEKKRGAIVLLASHDQEIIHYLSDEIFKMDQGSIIDHWEVSK